MLTFDLVTSGGDVRSTGDVVHNAEQSYCDQMWLNNMNSIVLSFMCNVLLHRENF